MIRLMVRHYITTGIAISAILLSCGTAMAEISTENLNATSLPTNDWSFWPTDDDKAPNNTVSGASRGSCSNDQVIALLPSSQYGLTSKSHPEILVATTSVDTTDQALFSMQSADGYYYETYIELPDTPGIINIALPSEAPALDVNQLYQWSLVLMCNNQLRPDSPAIQGWIQTQPINSNITTPSIEQAIEYREAHLWYDMVALLAELRRQEPTNQAVYEAWQGVLAGLELMAVVYEPIIK